LVSFQVIIIGRISVIAEVNEPSSPISVLIECSLRIRFIEYTQIISARRFEA